MPKGIPKPGNQKRPIGTRLIEMLRNATQTDLDAVDEEIKFVEAHVLGLKAAREVLAQAVLNRPASAVKAKKADAEDDDSAPQSEMAKKLARILHVSGPSRSDVLARTTGIDSVDCHKCLRANPEMFEKEGYKWRLTQKEFATRSSNGAA